MTDATVTSERPRFVPLSTYRLQVHGGFPLTAARDVVPYLAALGIGACYTSPYFTAAPGSTHGYDVSDHNEINPELGGAEALDGLHGRAHRSTASATSSTSCRTTWASAPDERVVERRARERAELAGVRCSSTSTGRPRTEELHAEAAAADPRRSVRPRARARRAAVVALPRRPADADVLRYRRCRSIRARRRASSGSRSSR